MVEKRVLVKREILSFFGNEEFFLVYASFEL
jgi:hypothetical protein